MSQVIREVQVKTTVRHHITLPAAAESLQSCPTRCDPTDGSPPGSPPLGFSRQEHWSGLPCPSPMHESENQSEVTLSCLTPSDPMDCSLPGPPYTGFSRQEYWSGFPSPRLPQNSETHRDNVFDITALTKLALLCLLRIWCFSGAISSSWHSFHMNCTKMPFVLRLM